MTVLRQIMLLCAAMTLLLAGCAGSAGTALQPPRCTASETLVCYGKTASRVETRMNQSDFCRCEHLLDGGL